MFPHVGLPYVLLQFSDLRRPRPALREKVVAGLFLSSPAPPAEVAVRLVDLIPEVGADRRMARQQLEVPAGDVFRCSPEQLAPETLSRRGFVLAPRVPKAERVCGQLYSHHAYIAPIPVQQSPAKLHDALPSWWDWWEFPFSSRSFPDRKSVV